MSTSKLKLYSYWWSSCSCRVRIGLNLKGLGYDYIAVNMRNGEHYSDEFKKLNPISYVPVLVDGDIVVSDSFAILMYLEENYPQHSLLPRDPKKRAINYQAVNIVSSSIQPFQNSGNRKFIEGKISSEVQNNWVKNHIERGFTALEKLLKDYAGKYATGDEAHLTQFPLLLRLHEVYSEHPAFQDAMPEKQPDAPSSRTT
ncbi:glutathione S-transferase zeta class-like isoform X2 [Tripterygium wilfordii]|uniref:glutathione S-transferase zeta class-like isoform X2 n=1 Tax=Tripterygium wilfordii TaxID=458696 RepID=UPI0018F860EB|nr:glutathione S-transferase zeta class-like isoform X2 [Tripterygium wilfordii]